MSFASLRSALSLPASSVAAAPRPAFVPSAASARALAAVQAARAALASPVVAPGGPAARVQQVALPASRHLAARVPPGSLSGLVRIAASLGGRSVVWGWLGGCRASVPPSTLLAAGVWLPSTSAVQAFLRAFGGVGLPSASFSSAPWSSGSCGGFVVRVSVSF